MGTTEKAHSTNNRSAATVAGEINRAVVACRKCPRLVEWREKVAREKTRRFREYDYWGRPVPAFGDPRGNLLIIGLAPAAHGANRTGRMFTGDRSGDWLYRALHDAGFANRELSRSADDGLKLHNCYITAACRCAPPGNKPTREEFANCAPYLENELKFFARSNSDTPKVLLCLGQLACRETLRALETLDYGPFRPRPKFGHGGVVPVADHLTLVNSYHPSQQNTFTGRLTREMFAQIFRQVSSLLQRKDRSEKFPGNKMNV